MIRNSSFGASNNYAWLGTYNGNNNAYYVNSSGGVNNNNQNNSYVVAPALLRTDMLRYIWQKKGVRASVPVQTG